MMNMMATTTMTTTATTTTTTTTTARAAGVSAGRRDVSRTAPLVRIRRRQRWQLRAAPPDTEMASASQQSELRSCPLPDDALAIQVG